MVVEILNYHCVAFTANYVITDKAKPHKQTTAAAAQVVLSNTPLLSDVILISQGQFAKRDCAFTFSCAYALATCLPFGSLPPQT